MDDAVLDRYAFAEDIEDMRECALPIPASMSCRGQTYYKIKRGAICNVVMDNALVFPFPFKSGGDCYLLAGNLVHPDKPVEIASKIKVAIVDHLMEITEGAKVTVAIWMQDHNDLWYRLNRPYSPHYAPVEVDLNSMINDFVSNARNESLVECGRLLQHNGCTASVQDLLCSDQHLSATASSTGSFQSAFYLEGIGLLESTSATPTRVNIRVNVSQCEVIVSAPTTGSVLHELRVRSGHGAMWYRLVSTPGGSEPSELAQEVTRTVDRLYTATYLTLKKVPQERFFTVVEFNLTDAQGMALDLRELGQVSPAGRITGELSGKIVPLAGDLGECPLIPIRAPVESYYLEVEWYKKQSFVTFYVKSALGDVWFRLVNPCSGYDKIPSSASDLLSLYDWPSDSEDVWRRMQNYKVVGKNGKLSSSSEVAERSQLHPFVVMCQLCPPPSTALQPLSFRFSPMQYSIDFGVAIGDDNAGLWFQTKAGSWYKALSPAAEDYRAIDAADRQNIETTIKLYDALLRLDEAICYYDQAKGKYFTDLTVDEVWQRSNGYFDLQRVRSAPDFVSSNLEHVLDFKKSKALKKSFFEAPAVPLQLLPQPVMSDLEPVMIEAEIPVPDKPATKVSAKASKFTQRLSDDEELDEDALFSHSPKVKKAPRKRLSSDKKIAMEPLLESPGSAVAEVPAQALAPKRRNRPPKAVSSQADGAGSAAAKLTAEIVPKQRKRRLAEEPADDGKEEQRPAVSSILSKPIPKKPRPAERGNFDEMVVDYVSRPQFGREASNDFSSSFDASRASSSSSHFVHGQDTYQPHGWRQSAARPGSSPRARPTFWSVDSVAGDQTMLVQARAKRDEEEKAKLSAWLAKGYDEETNDSYSPPPRGMPAAHDSSRLWGAKPRAAELDSFGRPTARSNPAQAHSRAEGGRDFSDPQPSLEDRGYGEYPHREDPWGSRDNNSFPPSRRSGGSGGGGVQNWAQNGTDPPPRWDEERHARGPIGAPASQCTYCKSLEKRPQCRNSRHIDGQGLAGPPRDYAKFGRQSCADPARDDAPYAQRGSTDYSRDKPFAHRDYGSFAHESTQDYHRHPGPVAHTAPAEWGSGPAPKVGRPKQAPTGYTCAHCATRRKFPTCPNPQHTDGELCKDIAASRATAAPVDVSQADLDDHIDIDLGFDLSTNSTAPTELDVVDLVTGDVDRSEAHRPPSPPNSPQLPTPVSPVLVHAQAADEASQPLSLAEDDLLLPAGPAPLMFVKSESSLSALKLCRHCKALRKLPECRVLRHQDGCHFEEHLMVCGLDPLNAGMCEFCYSMRKREGCPFAQHVHGHLLTGAAPTAKSPVAACADSITRRCVPLLAAHRSAAATEDDAGGADMDADVEASGTLGTRVLGEEKKERLRYILSKARQRAPAPAIPRPEDTCDEASRLASLLAEAASKTADDKMQCRTANDAEPIKDVALIELGVALSTPPSALSAPSALKRSSSDKRKTVQWADVANGKLREVREFDPQALLLAGDAAAV